MSSIGQTGKTRIQAASVKELFPNDLAVRHVIDADLFHIERLTRFFHRALHLENYGKAVIPMRERVTDRGA